MTSNDDLDRRPRLVAAWPALGPVGRVVLLQRRGAEGIAAAHGGVPAGGARGAHAAAAAVALPHPLSRAACPGWKPFIAIGLLNNVLPFSLIVVGQTYIPSGLASILNATTPLFTVVVMAVAGEEKLSARRIAGVVVGPDRRDHSPWRWPWTGARAGARHPALPCGRLLATACRRWWRDGCCRTRRRSAPRHSRCWPRPR